ncbi:alpha/beta fold hydrolase [Streptomyces griseoaurantiacus]|uniref:alpha/beta fold hydrolase n=1 Tax=Streptomyces griseoaurantiacus TaxID=68213 RepID=UPI002E2BB927|nr:alpha/beta hydrolase [Streptomyces jietaisiensis]WTI25914.1 alpha/beta hydrolase [Streptomyces jietaisiensis]
MKILSSDITLLHGRTTGIAALPDEATDQPLLVFVHGGGATSRSFDIPGHSQILRAARNGFPAYALDRPGYGGSEPLGLPADSDTGVLRAAAERLDQAVTELWQRHATTAPGVVVIGCSIGGAVATHLAALWSDQERPGWPLLGLALVDIGQLPPENVVDAWRSTPAEERIDMSELRGRITAPPLWTLAPHQFGLHSLPGILEPVVRAEGLEIVGGWPREWRHVASRITVPVHYRLGEFDTLWTARPDLVAEFADALRTRSPFVDAALFPGSAHGVADSVVGREYCLQVLGFAERCAAVVSTPQLLDPAVTNNPAIHGT